MEKAGDAGFGRKEAAMSHIRVRQRSKTPACRLGLGSLRAFFECALVAAATVAACQGSPGRDDSQDDPAVWRVPAREYRLRLGEARFVVPSPALPPQVLCQTANNNVDIIFHGGRLFLAWRSAPSHFASALAELWVISSEDDGFNWDFETRIALGTDVREPRFLSIGGELQLIFFEAGTDPLQFEPRALRRCFRPGAFRWTEPEVWRLTGEDRPVVPWDVKVRGNTAWLTGYAGPHYGGGEDALDVLFYRSHDGRDWQPVGAQGAVYRGGVSEVAFEFASDGSLHAVGRNEDGDESGFGSQVFWSGADLIGEWNRLSKSDPERYDSPEVFAHGADLYLAARRDVDGPFGPEGDMVGYSLRQKRSALFRLNTRDHSIEHLQDIPGVGDTAFCSVRRVGRDRFLLANYTSPLDAPDISWLEGQTSPRGTSIYLMDVELLAQ
jgi:hypothetical protein